VFISTLASAVDRAAPPRVRTAALVPLVLAAAAGIVRADATPVGPQPYLSAADSPFNSVQFSWFVRLTGETGAVSAPGVSILNAGGTPATVADPSSITDSVDGDDGHIDGSGGGGHSYFACPSFIDVRFNAAVLGSLPTHAGLVWTDGANGVVVNAYGPGGQLVGTMTGGSSDGSYSAGTAEDRFYGFVYAPGISRITMSDSNGCIEVDHIQGGHAGPAPCGPADIGGTGGVAGADGQLNNNDFVVFIDAFFASSPVADRGKQGGVSGSDGLFNNNDFIVFIDQFFAGC
jgi:hypothetical protein